jgi:coproporphyrinogen III oxidase-like Fe-S oxidoreductase
MSCRDVALERLVMGLRTNEGVVLRDLRHLNISPDRVDDLRPFVRVDNDRLIATRAGRLVLDRVVAELVLDHGDG